ncbi:MAG: hypothetical protein COA99_12165 [Moraxellaceae bacterium]|nr:MAG: hypothetical protein COA99_12165 [Moraxellaceae bacterium]
MNEFFVKLLGAFFLVSLITACGLVKSGDGENGEDSLIDSEQVDQLSLAGDDADIIGDEFLPTEEEAVPLDDLMDEFTEQAGEDSANVEVLEAVLDLIGGDLQAFRWTAPATESTLKASLSIVVTDSKFFGLIFQTWDDDNETDSADDVYTIVCESFSGCDDVEVLKEDSVYMMTFAGLELEHFVTINNLILSSGSLVIDTSED